ncbi:MAG: hypothetical protein ACE5H9_13470 [Anaerolineae bacterium]
MTTGLSRTDLTLLGILALAALSLFWPALLNPQALLHPTYSEHTDLLVIHWPKAYLMQQTWQTEGFLPRWNPLILSGMPLAANQLAMQFYPPAWLLLVASLNPTFNALFIFHLLLAGAGTYLLVRLALGRSPGAALLGGLTFMLTGKLLAHAAGGHVSLVGAVAWMPWAVLGLHGVLHTSRWRWAILAAVALAMQITTHTLITLYTGYLLAAYTVWELAGGSRRRERLRAAWPRLPAIPILAALLGAAQLLPLLELARYSNRAFSLDQAGQFALTPLQLLVGLFLPQAGAGHELIIYLGLAPLLVGLFGLSRKDRRGWFWAGVCLFALLFALGRSTPLLALTYYLAPGFRWVRTPARIFFPAALALAVLAGYGLDRLRAGTFNAGRRFRLLAVAGASLSLVLGLGLAFGFGQVNRAALGLAIFPPLTLAVIATFVLPAGQRLKSLLPPPVRTALLGLLIFADLASFNATVIRFQDPAGAFERGAETAARIKEAGRPGPFRVYSPSYSLPGQAAVLAGLELADGVEPVHLADYDRFMAAAGGYGQAAFSVTIPAFPPDAPLETALQDTEPDLRLLGLLNVEYLASAFPMAWPGLELETAVEDVFIYRNRQALPRAWVVHQTVEQTDDWVGQLRALPDLAGTALVSPPSQSAPAGAFRGRFFEPTVPGVLPEGRPAINRRATEQRPINGAEYTPKPGSPGAAAGVARKLISGRSGGVGLPQSEKPALMSPAGGRNPGQLLSDAPPSPVTVIDQAPGRLTVETDLSAPGLLVVSEIWYPGWTATVNGQPQAVERVDGLLQGVWLDAPGHYTVALSYAPRSAQMGSLISLVTIGALLGGGLVRGSGLVSYRK